MNSSRFNLIPVFLIIATTLIAFWSTLSHGLIWDDYSIINGSAIRELSPAGIIRFFVDKNAYHAPGEIYRPLYLLSFAIDYYLYGARAYGYHLTNLAFHISATLLVYYFISLLLKDLPRKGYLSSREIRRGGWSYSLPPLVGALVFAVHPIHTESVSWIKGRDDILALIFMLLALIFFIKYRRCGSGGLVKIVASMICFVLALLSKEMAVTLPLILILYDLSSGAGFDKIKKGIRLYLLYFIVLILFLVIRTYVLGQVGQSEYMGGGFLPSLFTTSRGFVRYIFLIFAPVGQCADYLGYKVSTSLTAGVVGSMIFLSFLVAIGIYSYRVSRIVFFAVIFFFITLLPVANLIPVKIYIAERFLYIPSLSIAILSALFIRALLSAHLQANRRYKTVIIISILVVSLLTVATIRRNKVWASGRAFWADVLKKYPSTRAYTNYGLSFEEAGDMENAELNYRLAIKSDPGYAFAYNNLAVILINKGNYTGAILNLRRSIKLDPAQAQSHVNLAIAFVKMGRLEEAVYEYDSALEIDPNLNEVRQTVERMRRSIKRDH